MFFSFFVCILLLLFYFYFFPDFFFPFLNLVQISFCQHTELTIGKETSEYKTKCDGYKYFKVKTNNPCKDLQIRVNHRAGDPNIYVSKDPERFPTLSRMVWSANERGFV